jgi:hypothetical protein
VPRRMLGLDGQIRGTCRQQRWSGRALLRFGALLAEQATKLLDLIAELADLLGQRRQVRMCMLLGERRAGHSGRLTICAPLIR